MSTAAWPPPPDLDSLKELFAIADVEGLIADGCPLDEYDPEAKEFFDQTRGDSTAQFTEANILPVLEDLFAKQFLWSPAQKLESAPAMRVLAEQIARFFGPEAQPQVRGAQ